MQINLKDIIYFIRIMEYPTITEAAVKLNVSQSSLTKFIHKMEGSLGRKLVDPGSQYSFLTTFGQDLIRRFAPYRQEFELSLINQMAKSGEYNGLIRIALPELVYTSILPRLSAEILTKYPKIRFDIVVLERPFLLEAEFRQIDLCFSIKPIDYQNCYATHLGALFTQLFCSQSYMAKYGVPCSITDLLGNHGQRLGLLMKRPLTLTNIATGEESVTNILPRVILPCLLLEHIEDSDLIVESFNRCDQTHDSWIVPVLPEYRLLSFDHYMMKNLERSTIVTDFVENALLRYISAEVPKFTGSFIK